MLGLLAAASLLAQYWGIISGAEVYVEPGSGCGSALLPLLDSVASVSLWLLQLLGTRAGVAQRGHAPPLRQRHLDTHTSHALPTLLQMLSYDCHVTGA